MDFKKYSFRYALAIIATIPIELIIVPKLTGSITTWGDAMGAVVCTAAVITVTVFIDSRRAEN